MGTNGSWDAAAPYLWRTARDMPADVTRSPNGGTG